MLTGFCSCSLLALLTQNSTFWFSKLSFIEAEILAMRRKPTWRANPINRRDVHPSVVSRNDTAPAPYWTGAFTITGAMLSDAKTWLPWKAWRKDPRLDFEIKIWQKKTATCVLQDLCTPRKQTTMTRTSRGLSWRMRDLEHWHGWKEKRNIALWACLYSGNSEGSKGRLVAHLVSFQCLQRTILQVTRIIKSFPTVHSRHDLDQQKTNQFHTIPVEPQDRGNWQCGASQTSTFRGFQALFSPQILSWEESSWWKR